MMFNVYPSQLVEVHWTDPAARCGWHRPASATMASVVSVGLVGETRDDCIVLVSSLADGELEGDVTAIPWGIVTAVYIFVLAPREASSSS